MLFNRDAELAESWMAAREAVLENEDGESTDVLMKKQKDFEKAIAIQVKIVFKLNLIMFTIKVILLSKICNNLASQIFHVIVRQTCFAYFLYFFALADFTLLIYCQRVHNFGKMLYISR